MAKWLTTATYSSIISSLLYDGLKNYDVENDCDNFTAKIKSR